MYSIPWLAISENLTSLARIRRFLTCDEQNCFISICNECSAECLRIRHLKKSTTAFRYGEITEEIVVSEQDPKAFAKGGIDVRMNNVLEWIPHEKKLKLDCGDQIAYSKLCICTGASAKSFRSEFVLTLRDTETIEALKEKLKSAKRVLILGNGGIVTELVFELSDVEVIWAIRHATIAATYFDEAAAKFFASRLTSGRDPQDSKKEARCERYTVAPSTSNDGKRSSGCALGPFWSRNLAYDKEAPDRTRRKVTVIENVEAEEVSENRPEVDELRKLERVGSIK